MKILNTFLISLLAYSASAQVGIGTSEPSGALDIETTETSQTALDINNTSSGDPSINLQVSGDTKFTVGIDNSDFDKLKIGTDSTFATTPAITIDASQNVGIGNTSPTATLDVDGSAIFNESGNSVDFRVEGLGESNLLFVDGSTDRVGIGTATPKGLLDVPGTVYIDNSRFIESVGVTYLQVGADFTVGSAQDFFIGNMYDNTSVSERKFMIKSDGKVGIGIASPSTNLHIFNEAASTNSVLDILTITAESSGTPAAGIGAGIVFEIEDALTVSEEQGRINVELDDVSNGSEDATMTFDINQGGTMTEVMRIDGTDGYVGIGTSSPSAMLEVRNTTGSAYMKIRGDVGTASTRAGLIIDRTSQSRGGGVWIESSADGGSPWYAGVPYAGGSASNGFSIGYHATQAEHSINSMFYISSGGDVGIGTSEPTAKFHVEDGVSQFTGDNSSNGTVKFTPSSSKSGTTSSHIHYGSGADWYIRSGSAVGKVIIQDTGGNVGIGTSTPSQKLDVVGHAEINGTISLPASSTQSRNIEIGTGRSGNGFSYIDLIGDATYTDYGLRLIRNGGANGWTHLSHRGTGEFQISTIDAGDLVFETTSAARMRIGSTGLVGIGRTAATNILEVAGDASKTSSGDWLANSDARLKKEIKQMDSQRVLDKMLALKGVTYYWNDTVTGSKRPTQLQYGFTAQNIQEVFPILVEEDNLGYLQTAYGTYDAMYVESMRALQEQIDSQQMIIEAQKAEIATEKVENESQKQEIETIKAEASSSSVETNQKLKETTKKLAELEAKLNALLLLNSQGAVVTAEN
ncbi:MAG: hypothetical protein ACI9U0_002276 [Flavobacteriales bacterium]|jgi:hypothetical protein